MQPDGRLKPTGKVTSGNDVSAGGWSLRFSLTVSFHLLIFITHPALKEPDLNGVCFLFLEHEINLIILSDAQLILGVPLRSQGNQFMFNWRSDIFFCVSAKREREGEGGTFATFKGRCAGISTCRRVGS